MARQAAEQESELLKGFRALYEEGNRAWNEGDFRRAYGAFPEEFEHKLSPIWPEARTLRGPDEIVAFFEAWRETFPDTRVDLREFIQADERTIIVGFDVHGTGAGSGAFTKMEIWQVWEIEEDLRPIRVAEFPNRSAALEAAGVQERGGER